MTFDDRGKYISILSLMHQQGRMTEETIRFLVGSVSDTLRAKFKVDEKGFWYNTRLEEETEKRNNFTESRRINGNLGGRPKKSKANGKPTKNLKVKHMGNHMEDEDVNENIDVNTKGAKQKKSIAVPFDSPNFLILWDKWKQYRKEIGKPYRSDLSEQAALKMLSKYNCGAAMQMIEQSIANSWQGIFELKNTNGKPTAQQKLADAGERLNSYASGYKPKP